MNVSNCIWEYPWNPSNPFVHQDTQVIPGTIITTIGSFNLNEQKFTVEKVSNGYILRVGLDTFVFQTKEELSAKITELLV